MWRYRQRGWWVRFPVKSLFSLFPIFFNVSRRPIDEWNIFDYIDNHHIRNSIWNDKGSWLLKALGKISFSFQIEWEEGKIPTINATNSVISLLFQILYFTRLFFTWLEMERFVFLVKRLLADYAKSENKFFPKETNWLIFFQKINVI